jgi:hypothetical protein
MDDVGIALGDVREPQQRADIANIQGEEWR